MPITLIIYELMLKIMQFLSTLPLYSVCVPRNILKLKP